MRPFARPPTLSLLFILLGLTPGCAGGEDGGSDSAGSDNYSGTGGTPMFVDETGGAGSGTGGVGPNSGGNASTGGSLGTGGVATGGQGTGGSQTGCAGKGYLICEDFESATLGSVPAGWTEDGELSEVANDAANSGSQSLKLGPKDNGPRRILHDASVLGSAHFGRIFYRVKLPVPDAFVHSTLVELRGVGPNIGEASYRVVDTVKAASDAFGIENKHQFLYNVQPNGAEFGEGTSYDWYFEEEWHCAEWHIDSSDQSYTFYLDGDEVMSFTRGAGNYADAEIPDSFSELRVGWNNYQTAPPGFTAWIDDVALDDERIGCEP